MPQKSPSEIAHWLGITLHCIGDAVIATDAESRVTFMNPVAELLTGWASAEAMGLSLETVFKIVNEESHRQGESPVTKALREGVVVGLANHTMLVARDGTERSIDDSAAPIRDESGQVAGVVLVFRDISERRKHEREINAALDFCNNILATLREPFLVLNGSFEVIRANDAFYQTFKVSPQNTEHKSVYELGDGQWNIPQLRTLLEEILLHNSSTRDFEVEQDFPTIGNKIMLLNARRIYTENHPVLILLAIEDVTDRRRLDRRLQKSEMRYRRLFEAARDGILILSADTGEIIDANAFMSELLHYSHEQLIGKQLYEIGLFNDVEKSKAAFSELLDKHYIRYENLPLETEGGETREVEFISNLYQEDHHPVLQCNIRDITQRRVMERQLERQSYEMAEAHRQKDAFLAMLAHELRNPLSPIFNALHLLGLEKGENQLQREARSVIDRQVRHLARLVDDLLEVARVTTGRIRLRLEKVELNALVEHSVEAIRSMINRKKQTIDVTLHPSVLWLNADATRLEQIVGNILTNASKYTAVGGNVRVTVEQDRHHAVIRVADNGDGIAPDLLPRIFDLFTQADHSLARSEGGLGIGLALVKSLVELHRGTVTAASGGLGQGSEFTVRVPLASAFSSDEVIPYAQLALKTDSLRILVVDDGEDAAKMAALLLRASGHDIRIAHAGHAALEIAADFKPQVVLLDIGLPEMDGYEVARRLRQLPQTKNTLLVAVTGYGQDSDRRRSKEAGFDHHLLKPVEYNKLSKLLSEVDVGQS